jgi:glycosyltransferase involved in cell wall biosynthesis
VSRSGDRIGVVLIGRNEGDRLVRALDAVCDGVRPVVYVDSGSTDDSVEQARRRGAEVVSLDMATPFTAARARNAGFDRLREVAPDAPLVQFIDGDCEIAPGWMEAAQAFLDEHPDVVAVCGYRRERFPERTIFNRICDVEWRNGSIGAIACFGGDVMMRSGALERIGGYDAGLIAGEDEEVGIRLRHDGGTLWRIDKTSTLHDADMHRVGQWWQRAKRCGHAYAQLYGIYGAPPERKFADELRRSVLWGAFVPASVVALAVPTIGLSLVGLGVYPLRAVRVAHATRQRGFSWPDAVVWGLSCAASPIPEAIGVAKFHLDRLRRKRPKLIEYK